MNVSSVLLVQLIADGHEPLCQECLYWHRWAAKPHAPPLAYGDCRRHAPGLAVEHKMVEGTLTLHASTKWPSTRECADACGDFAPDGVAAVASGKWKVES